MLACVGDLDIDTTTFTPGLADRVGQAFLKRFPGYPVVKIRLKPGEAYIAPTENMLHEGSSLHIDETGFQFILLGHFKAIE